MARRGGIDLGGTKIQAAILDARHKVLAESRRPTPTDGGPEAVAEEMVATLKEAAGSAKVKTESLAGVGVGSPGAVDARRGTVSEARNLPDFMYGATEAATGNITCTWPLIKSMSPAAALL